MVKKDKKKDAEVITICDLYKDWYKDTLQGRIVKENR